MATSHQTPTPPRRLASDPAVGGAEPPPPHDATTSTTLTSTSTVHAAGPGRNGTTAHDQTNTPQSARRPAQQPVPRQRVAMAAVRDVNDPDIDAALDAVVEAAPPLPYEVRARLAWLLQEQHTRGQHVHGQQPSKPQARTQQARGQHDSPRHGEAA
jgi:hypothetical protein